MSSNVPLPEEAVYTTPQFLGPTIIETPITAEGPGPFYVYTPGFTFRGLTSQIKFFSSIKGGQVRKIESNKDWVNQGQLPEVAAATKRTYRSPFGEVLDTHFSYEIPAQATLNTLLADRSLTQKGLTYIKCFDGIEAHEVALNSFINRVAVKDRQSKTGDKQIDQILATEGMLRVRAMWLEKSLEELHSRQMLEDFRRYLDAKPYLYEVWTEAIEKYLLPAIEGFILIANTELAKVEERMRSGKQDVYDGYSNDLMWLLGRKPERTALSRTLESAAALGGRSGLSIEEIQAIVSAAVGASQKALDSQRGAVAPVEDTVQCTDCGQYCEMVKGGPPRICFRCGFEFLKMQAPVIDDTEIEDAVIVNTTPQKTPEELAADLMKDLNGETHEE
jgi:hypothetical protein